MKKLLFYFGAPLIVTLFGFLSISKSTEPFHDPTFINQQKSKAILEVSTMLKKMMQEEQIVGMAVSISHNDSLLLSEGFGYCDLGKQKMINPRETHFRIASISKPITSTILGRLTEKDIIELDKSIYSYVSDFPKKNHDFTIRHLATHQSGIRHYKRNEKENTIAISMEEGLNKFKNSKLKFEPGTEYLYSSYGYNLLGVAMEKASNSSYEELLKTYVTDPLDMQNTKADNGIYENISTSGFFEVGKRKKVKKADNVNFSMKLPSGGLLSTSEDLVKFGNSYIYSSLLKESTQKEMLTNTTLTNGKSIGYGLGWGISYDPTGRKIISHSGGNTGSVCRLIIYPEEKLTVAVVSNTFGIDWLKFMRTVNKIPNIILDQSK